jgi:folylpolyglutamate synthase/dihydropteroate synthase
VARAVRVIVTAPPSPRAMAPAELARVATVAGAADVTVADDLAAALASAAAAGERVVVAGSIFLVGEARRIVLGEAADPVAAQDPPAAQKL